MNFDIIGAVGPVPMNFDKNFVKHINTISEVIKDAEHVFGSFEVVLGLYIFQCSFSSTVHSVPLLL